MSKKPRVWEMIFLIIKMTFVGFGGGNALMPVLKNEAVDKKKWITVEEFDKIVIVSNMLPGPSVIEAISYLAIKVFGFWKGAIITFFAMLPHILLAYLFYFLIYLLPQNFISVISVGVLTAISGVLLAFGYEYMKSSKKEISMPLWLILFLFTFAFCLFIPSPFNIPIVVMIIVFICFGLFQFLSYKKAKKKQNGDK